MYSVRIVDGHTLPTGRDWALVRNGSICYLFLRRGAVTASLIEEVINQTAAVSVACLADSPEPVSVEVSQTPSPPRLLQGERPTTEG